MQALPHYLTPAATEAIKRANAAHRARLADMRRERVYRELVSKLRRPMANQDAAVRIAEFPLIGTAS